MKKIQVKVCVCTACVMNGSVEIMESVESLRDLREQMEEGYTAEEHEVLEIATDKCLGGLPHQEDAPVIAVDAPAPRPAAAAPAMAFIVERVQNGEQ